MNFSSKIFPVCYLPSVSNSRSLQFLFLRIFFQFMQELKIKIKGYLILTSLFLIQYSTGNHVVTGYGFVESRQRWRLDFLTERETYYNDKSKIQTVSWSNYFLTNFVTRFMFMFVSFYLNFPCVDPVTLMRSQRW